MILVNKDKCNNCHSCVSACPVKTCIDASGDIVGVVEERCLGCGHCIPACKHGARTFADDTEAFFAALSEKGEKRRPVVVIVAPAAATVFESSGGGAASGAVCEDGLRHLNGYLKAQGAAAVFDAAFGAELTVKSYLEYAKTSSSRAIIAQPCPAIVSWCQVYKPHLLEHLAPVHSPMLHTAIMVREFFPEYKDALIAAVSPCVAKRREFEETGFVRFNVTMLNLKKRLEAGGVSLASFPALDYDGPRAERAVLFSTPGGLRATVAREAPRLVSRIRKIEGTEAVYKYLSDLPAMVKRGDAPFIIDCLNCEAGCNGGPGTGNYDKPLDELEAKVERRRQAAAAAKGAAPFGLGLRRDLHKYWRPGLYTRKYEDKSALCAGLKTPDEPATQEIFRRMKKFRKEDEYNCCACGYGSCRDMAFAIYNSLNKSENCFHYLEALSIEREREREEAGERARQLVEEIRQSRLTILSLYDKVSSYLAVNAEQEAILRRSSGRASAVIRQVREATQAANEKRDSIDSLAAASAEAQKNMRSLRVSFSEVEKTTEKIAGIAGVIEDMATATNLLSMNAAIEAAHAGETGKGFAVVAGEIRKLAATTGANASSISASIDAIVTQINTSLRLSEKADAVMERMTSGVTLAGESFAEVIRSQDALSGATAALTGDLDELGAQSARLRESEASIKTALEAMRTLARTLGEQE